MDAQASLAEASLAEARRAWRAKREAESQLARLARYARA